VDRIRLTAQDVEVGSSLNYAVYDAMGKLMLREGCAIANTRQLNNLLKRGMYIERPRDRHDFGGFSNHRAENDHQPLSAHVRMSEFRDRIRSILRRICSERQERPGIIVAIGNIAQELHDICQNYQDTAILAVHLFYHDEYLADHPLHATIVSDIVATQLGIDDDDRQSLLCAALTHDIALVPHMGALNQHEKLNAAQVKLIQEHAQQGVEKLKELGVQDAVWLEAVALHHERMDGSGYPDKLAGEAIPISARILMAADVYSALVRNRPYRNEVFKRNALEILLELSNSGQLDRQVTQTLIKAIGLYPPGTLLRLKDKRIAVSIARGSDVYKPKLMLIGNHNGNPLPRTKEVSYAEIEQEISPSKYRGLYPVVDKLLDT
jgi:HD-GYP domain-containing protein (c-di-GMP phosphodiesterase class II)